MKFLGVLLSVMAVSRGLAWSPQSLFHFASNHQRGVQSSLPADESFGAKGDHHDAFATRRAFFGAAAAMSVGVVIGAAPAAVWSADGSPATIYKSGKAPVVPGGKPRDKNDVKGTRKDPDFLRSVADCRSQCQNSLGSDGYARAKEDCLSECQDICCKTYEQCTFDIVPRI